MSYRVTLALVGDPASPFTRIPDDELNRPWDERPRVELEVDDEESLQSVVDRALPLLGVELEGESTAFGRVDIALYSDESPRGFVSASPVMALVDDEGRLVWGVHDYRLIPFGQVLRSAEAGVLPGDPMRLHLVLKEPIGDGVGIDWTMLFQAWEAAREVIQIVGEVGGAVAVAKMLLERLGKGKKVAERDAHRWAQRGATFPKAFSDALNDRPWSSAHLAELMGCSQEDAESILAVFGFAPGEDGLWHPTADEAARLLRGIYEEALWSHLGYTEEDVVRFRNRLEQFFRTGERAPWDYAEEEEYDDLPGDDEDYCAYCGRIWPKAYLVYAPDKFTSICGDCVSACVLAFTQHARRPPRTPGEPDDGDGEE